MIGWVVRYPDADGTLTVAGQKMSGRYFDRAPDANQFWAERASRGQICHDMIEVHHKVSRPRTQRHPRQNREGS